jgi:hypothetical protein
MLFGFVKRAAKGIGQGVGKLIKGLKRAAPKKPQGIVKEQVKDRAIPASKKTITTGSRAVGLSPEQAVKAPPKKIITVPDRTPAQAAASAKAKKDLLKNLSTNNLRTRTPAGMTTQGAKFFNPNPPPLTGTSYLAQTGQVQPTIPTMAKLGAGALVGAGAVGAGTTAVVMNKKKKKKRK